MTRTQSLESLEVVLIIGIGGFAGSNLRYFVDSVLPHSLVSTATVNVLGCVALGFFLYEKLYTETISQPARTVLSTGFISSFTTYSTFVLDAITATPLIGVGYLAGSYALGFFGVLVGRAGARRVMTGQQSVSGVPTDD
jgi:Integral membrane protein possibly involved in chromosome condensation